MVKVTFEQDGLVEDVTSGEFVLAVINTPQKQSNGRVCILGQATDITAFPAELAVTRLSLWPVIMASEIMRQRSSSQQRSRFQSRSRRPTGTSGKRIRETV